MAVLGLVVAVAIGYLLGAIPSGVIVGRLRGVDPRSGGSGRTGATNAMRTLGVGPAIAVLVLDLAKGAVAALVGAWVADALGSPAAWGAALAGAAATAGHVRSVFIGFTGGRGVATGGGVMLVLAPVAVVVALVVMLVVIALSRYVSLGSIVGAGVLAAGTVVLAVLGWTGTATVGAAVVIAAIVVAAHADNIGRLLSGTERRLGRA